MQLSGRTVLVTGGASGLGGATVDMVVAEGGRAVVIDLNDDNGRAKEANHRGAVRFVKGDVTAEADVQRAVDVALADFGGVHGLVNAAGIPAAEREQVFQPFYRADPSRNVDTGGIGLGLPIARSTARAHGGDVELQPAEKGLVAKVTLQDVDDLFQLVDQYGIGATLLKPSTPAVKLLDRLSGWERVHADATAVLHRRASSVPVQHQSLNLR